tara:strand:+ start:1615 stop:2499 length:885 start_codon:yes stop_codon:yes gene_type:complete
MNEYKSKVFQYGIKSNKNICHLQSKVVIDFKYDDVLFAASFNYYDATGNPSIPKASNAPSNMRESKTKTKENDEYILHLIDIFSKMYTIKFMSLDRTERPFSCQIHENGEWMYFDKDKNRIKELEKLEVDFVKRLGIPSELIQTFRDSTEYDGKSYLMDVNSYMIHILIKNNVLPEMTKVRATPKIHEFDDGKAIIWEIRDDGQNECHIINDEIKLDIQKYLLKAYADLLREGKNTTKYMVIQTIKEEGLSIVADMLANDYDDAKLLLILKDILTIYNKNDCFTQVIKSLPIIF